ncbi:hypothetical protein RSAG8_00851, partial [Rhizoctonia solani AG-8 WAC10335]
MTTSIRAPERQKAWPLRARAGDALLGRMSLIDTGIRLIRRLLPSRCGWLSCDMCITMSLGSRSTMTIILRWRCLDIVNPHTSNSILYWIEYHFFICN